METQKKIIHGSREWRERRRGGIGSSDAAAIMEVSPWTTPFELFLEKTGRISGRIRSPWEWRAMERGRKLEPEARASFEAEIGIPMPADYAVNPRYPMLRANVDGLNLEHGKVAEFKAPGKVDHLVAVRGVVPEKYLWQCVHIMLVCELPEISYYSYRDGSGVWIRIPRDAAREREYLDRALKFWRHVETDTPPWDLLPANVFRMEEYRR